MLNYKQLYKRIYEENLGDKIIDEQREDIFKNLYIDDFSRPFLHTLILLDDVAQTKILRNEKTYIQELLTQCRHINCSFFLAVQFWKALTVNIKENTSTVFVFSGYSKRQLRYIFSQTNTPVDLEQIWKLYSRMQKRSKLIVDSQTNEIFYE
jgi:hypothetical protein